MSADLIQELRDACSGHPQAKIAWPHRLLHDAADTLAANVKELAEISDALQSGEAFGFDPATEFLHSDDGGAPDHCVFFVPKEELAEIRAENERLDATCTALDKYASEMLGRATAAESENERLRKALEEADAVILQIAVQPEKWSSPDGTSSYGLGYAFHIVKHRAERYVKDRAASRSLGQQE